MTRFSALLFLILLSLILAVPTSEILVAGISVSSSSDRELTFRWELAPQSEIAKNSRNVSLRERKSVFPLGEHGSLEANVLCFWAPSKQVNLLESNLQTGDRINRAEFQSVVSGALGVELVEPVMIRGRWFGKVIIPSSVIRNNEVFEVIAADISLVFGPGNTSLPANLPGPLDVILDNLCINATEAHSWSKESSQKFETVAYNPFSQSSNWLRIAITESGIYRLTRSDLLNAGYPVSSVDPRTIRLFHAGGKPLPIRSGDPRDSLAEMAIRVIGEEDGSFGDQDIVVFYANAGDFIITNPQPDFIRHPYSDRGVYYLTYGGDFDWEPRRMPTVNGTVPGAVDTLTRYLDFLHFEEEDVLSQSQGDIFDFYNWYWGQAGDLQIHLNLPAPAALSENRFRIRMTRPPVSLEVNNFLLQPYFVDGRSYYYATDRLTSGTNTIEIDYPFVDGYYTDDVLIQLERVLTLSTAGSLNFYLPADGAGHAYKITGQFDNPMLLDIDDIFNQAIVTPLLSGSSISLFSTGAVGEIAGFALTNASALKSPFSIVATQIDDIRSTSNAADYIIIVHDNLYNETQEYASYRRQRDNLRVRVIRISDIYAQFSGGRLDPIAIRDFLRYAFLNWSGAKPSYCLLVGDGVYDFRNNLGTGAINYIPPYVVEGDETVSDENFAHVDSLTDLDSDNSYPTDRGVDIVIARWPVKTAAEFQDVFNKIRSYETGEDAGKWRNVITLIADDENHPNSGPELFHTQDTEELANTIIPARFDLEKIYGISYPFGAAAEKPEMRDAIIRSLNDGRLIVNYTGHGNQNLWADERVFRRTQDIPRLSNSHRLPLIFNASCSIGFFDDPRSEGMAEDLLRYPAGGAVGTISATRLVYARPNFLFNKAGMTQLLDENNYTIAEAMYVSKLLRQGGFGVGDNDRKYIYIGDPLTKLAIAPNKINFVSFDPDSLVALTVTELVGRVEDREGTPQFDFDGTTTVSVFDNSRQRAIAFGSDTVRYSQYGPEIYRGNVGVSDGEFRLKFVVPKDISYGGTEARISAYAASSNSGAAGVIFPIAIGSINKDVSDSTGPDIDVFVADNLELTDEMTIAPGSELTLQLFDSLGINLSGEIGHGIELEFDGNKEFSYEITDSFSYDTDSYQRGRAKLKLPNLMGGEHVLKVKAWDSANNSSQELITFNLSSFASLEIRDFLCYPNPVKNSCEFAYTLSDDAQDVTLKLFTVSGLEIWSLSNLPGTRGYHQGIAWNGLDSDGDRPANGVYLMQVSARPAAVGSENVDNSKATATGKMVVLK